MKEVIEALDPIVKYLLVAWILGILTWMVVKRGAGTPSSLIATLNALNQPWIAICVIILGMVFDIVCQKYGVSNDAATGVIGAGVGLLTGQALNRADHSITTTTPSSTIREASSSSIVPPPNPTLPVGPAKEN